MKVVLTYKDGAVGEFIFGALGPPLELDLDGENAEDLFSVVVMDAAGRTVFSAYHWHNKPPE